MYTKNLNELIALVADATPTTAQQYPALKELTGANAENFLLGHSLRHLSGSTGDLQKIIEGAEHDSVVDKELFKRKLFSAQFSLCKLYSLFGMEEINVVEGVEKLVVEYSQQH